MVNIIVSSFYKYINLKNLEDFQKKHLDFCNNLGIKGKILVSEEGINGSVSGTKEQITKYEKEFLRHKEFSDIKFKRTTADKYPFKKTIVRIRDEIVTSRFDVDTKKVGKYVTPSELKRLYDKNEDFVIIDTRNNYESKIGKFRNAIIPNIKTFREFQKKVRNLKSLYKHKKVVLYCTGGVRCEKASALLIKEGFSDINQLHGGIISYINQYPNTYFDGRCFVFDDRISINSGRNTKDIALCEKCHLPCGNYINCKNTKCNKLFICCDECKKQYENTCSGKCKKFS